MSDSNMLDTQPGKLPAMTAQEVRERAQRILDLRGKPPYTQATFGDSPSGHGMPREFNLSPEETLVISEFVTYWLPYLVIKE